MGFLTRLIAGFVAASTLGAGLAGTANAVDAAGAASDTTGAVTTTADDTGGRTVLDCRQSGEGATGPYADKFCWIDWSNLPLDSSGKPTPVRINVPGGHIDADATITHTDNAALTAKDYTGSKWSRLIPAYKLTGNTALAFSGRMGRQDPAASVTFSNVTPSADRTDTGVNVLKDFQLAFGDAEVMSGGVLQGHDVYERTDIESDKTLEKLGMIGSGDPNQSYSKANTGYGTTHVTLAGGPKGATDDANKDSKGAAVVGAKQASRFKVSFGQVNQHWDGWGSAIAVGVYMPYLTAYPLTYDKNASDAAGEVPSNQRGKENTTQPAKTKTNGTVKTVADDTSNLPDHLVNGDFSVNYKDQWLTGGWNWTSITPDGKYLNSVRNWNDSATTWKTVNGWDKTKFGWSSTQKDGTDNIQHKAGAVEIQYDDQADNVYAELCAYEKGTAIYQDIKTVPGTLYKVRLKHASLYDGYLDKMQVMIGAPGHEQPVEMTRTGVNGNGDKLNEKSNIIATKVSNTGENDRNHDSQWESYEGTYLIPAGQTVTRFTFRSIGSRNLDHGNLLDDIVFDKAYRLDYDKNASDATGKVPSNQRGRENTTQPAKSKTTGTVKTVVDTSDGLPTELVNGDFEYPGADVLSQNLRDKKRNWWGVSRKDKMVYESDNPTKWVSLPSTFDSDRFAWDSSEAGKTSGVQEGSSQWHTNEVELQRDSRTGNMYAELSPYQAQSSIRQYIRTTPGALYKVRLKHASLSSEYLDKMQVLIGADGNEQPVRMTRVESQNGLDAIGESTASTTISTHASNKAEISWGSGLGYHSSRNHDGQWATYEGVYVATSDVTVFTFKSVDSPSFNTGNLLDDVVFTKAYKLTYDKNSADASGQVPSNQRGKENTTQPAKTKTNGTVKTVADDDSSKSLTVNPGFDVPDYSKLDDGGLHWMYVNPSEGNAWSYYDYINPSAPKHQVAGLSQATFGWQELTGGTNHYSEISAAQSGATIYQDVATVPGVMYKWSLKHASLDSSHLDKMSVIIGEPGKETAQEATRTTANGHGDKLGKVGTVISTKVSNPEMPAGNKFQEGAHTGQWETYTGTYIATGTVTRFAFRSVEGYSAWDGNLLDDISFSKAYKLTYDKNASDATGSVPSDTTANTVKQAKADATGTVKTVTDTKTKTSGTVKTVADTNASLPDHLVNGDFNVNYHDQWKDSFGGWTSIDPNAGKTLHATSLPNGSSWKWTAINGWDKSKFGWTSTQKAGSNVQQKANAVELQYDDSTADNVYAELCAYEAGTAIYQDIRTVPGTLYKVRLKHASLNSTYLDKMQVMIGTPGHEQPVEMTRTTVNGHGDKLNEKSTTIATKVTNSNNRHHADQWETYEGTYLIPDGQTTTRFTFKSIDAKQLDYGNVLDDIVFDKAYRLSYDKNANDAYGQVPSDTTANTVKQAKAKTTGTVRTVADRTASGLTVHDLETDDVPGDYRQFVLNTTDTRLSQVEFEDGAWYRSTDSSSQGMWPLKAGASLTIPSVGDWTDPSGRTHQISMTMRLKDWNGGSVSELYRFDGHGNIVGDGRFWINTAYGSGYSSLPAKVKAAMGGVDTSKRVGCSWTVEFTYADTGEKVPDTFRGVTGFNDLDGWDAQPDLKFEGVQLLSGFDGAYKRSDAELGTYGVNGFAGVRHDAGDEAHLDAPQQSRHRLAATWTGSTFTFSYDLGNPAGRTDGSRMTFGSPVTRTAVLTYDKNASDATGSVPSNTMPGTTQTVSSDTDGTVKDLVQRTTTHADGSVTVRTVDATTDVVSGCQVYYPAGQRITLATMAKDDDCWDSSMLSRPGHTQLGWNQDRNATQAQAQVTMVEGGMTVYAVWVGNPVLTYDTNKPSTWSGQMPSTPASVSVAYNTAAADGSGWKSGDTTKIRGYRFLGWYTGPQDNAGLYDWTRPLTGSVTVYAHWQRLQANVVYNANGGTGSHANTTGWQYSDVTVPGDTSKSFKRDKYVFKGWGTKPGKADVVYKDGSKVALQDKDITLYAQWQEVHENFVETGGIGLPIAIAGGVLLLMFGIGSTVMLTRRMNGHGMPDDE